MALGPIGNVTYINQNSQLGSLQHANNLEKVGITLNANMQEFLDKMKNVQEISPIPETHEIDSNEKQHQEKQNSEDENKTEKNELKVSIENGESSTSSRMSLLDVRV